MVEHLRTGTFGPAIQEELMVGGLGVGQTFRQPHWRVVARKWTRAGVSAGCFARSRRAVADVTLEEVTRTRMPCRSSNDAAAAARVPGSGPGPKCGDPQRRAYPTFAADVRPLPSTPLRRPADTSRNGKLKLQLNCLNHLRRPLSERRWLFCSKVAV